MAQQEAPPQNHNAGETTEKDQPVHVGGKEITKETIDSLISQGKDRGFITESELLYAVRICL
ncbi:MAG: hypothetical protein BRC23_00605 [Parcubacteria group bacterium SW_4_49_11]|nr:MAG: hypothetical protein BRC23_00605 [Parcubacteria group bacterium SW_4_49_11]